MHEVQGTDLFLEKRWPLSFFSMPIRSSSFFLREATICSFLSSPVFLASASLFCRHSQALPLGVLSFGYVHLTP